MEEAHIAARICRDYAGTLRRMFEGVKPFDWLMLGIETAVLLLILYEVVVGIVRHCGARRRQKELSRIITSLSQFMDEGLELQKSVPDTATEQTGVLRSWITNTKAWGDKINTFLVARSRQASAAFLLVHDLSSSDSVVFAPSGEVFYLASPLREHYQRLLTQLNSLRQIIEKPEVYF
ncbi:MAG: hypothetical protein WA899_02265 [Candidatus Sulfotelmatobacter sp.]